MSDDEIVPYGRSFDEYCLMFCLGEREAGQRVVGIGDGPSNFNAEASRRGWQVVSVDPIYRFACDRLADRCEAVVETMVGAVAMTPSHWIWSYHADEAELRVHRRRTTADFVRDFGSPRSRHRYVAGELPHLPFATGSFDIALCSHLLFSWSGVLDADFHIGAITEMLRVADEVRVCPTGRNLAARRSKHLDAIVATFARQGYDVSVRTMTGQPPAATAERLVISRPDRRAARGRAARTDHWRERIRPLPTPLPVLPVQL
jgi:hypothetical protein